MQTVQYISEIVLLNGCVCDCAYCAKAFNKANGGDCGMLPWGMYDDINSACTKQWKQRMEYVGARFGAFTSILGFEIVNEVDGPYGAAHRPFPVVNFTSWLKVVVETLRGADQGGHLITTNFAATGLCQQFAPLPFLDYMGYHGYGALGDGAAQAQTLGAGHALLQESKRGKKDKPLFFSELVATSTVFVRLTCQLLPHLTSHHASLLLS